MNPKQIHSSRLMACACALMFALVSGSLWALPSDAQQDLEFESDGWRWDKNGAMVYEGNVTLQQGSMKIKADKITIHRGEGKRASKVIAIGKPAHFQQIPELNAQPVIAEADRLEYEVDKEILMLLGDAELDQEGSSLNLSANTIEYDVKNGSFRAASNVEGNETKKRVRMVVPPNALEPNP